MRRRGFTLIEVMIALAILGMGLVILVKSIAGNATAAGDSFYLGVVTDLTRGKMYDIEEKLLDEGYQDAVQEDEGDFGEQGWEGIKWKSTVEPVELPSYDKLIALKNGEGAGSGSGSGSGDDGEGENLTDKFQSSALGGMLGMLGGGFGGGGSGGAGGAGSASELKSGAFLQSSYPLIQKVLKDSIRKITLEVSWNTGVHRDSAKVYLYVTDPAGMQKSLGVLGI
jgi:general secretion pathway protein I